MLKVQLSGTITNSELQDNGNKYDGSVSDQPGTKHNQEIIFREVRTEKDILEVTEVKNYKQ